MPAIVYDTGALLAAERRNPDFLALHDELTSARIRLLVPVVVLAQARFLVEVIVRAGDRQHCAVAHGQDI